ncbi:acyltransferase [Vibrio aquaticus]|uniref:Acyltransferase n=1 Tax=Vibrio aquaticus TaxID=2496559 RepID=A0A3S0MM34_9VIBR|nr:acyltransferase [Vibrio aquaticus]RTZ17723.1 acyltransferase [Vibrio aquaticus]
MTKSTMPVFGYMKSRNVKIDTLRGLACLLLVTYHVIGSEPQNGLRIAEGAYRELNDILAYLRMPLFTFLSGLVYAYRPFQTGAKDFLVKKARRLLLPMLIVGTAFAFLQSITPGSNASITQWYLLHIKPVAHFWFIESLFVLFVLIVLFERSKLFDTFGKFTVTFAAMSCLYLSPIDIAYFSINGTLYLAPYFFAGMAMKRYVALNKLNGNWRGLMLGSVVVTYYLVGNEIVIIDEQRSLLALVLGICSCVALMGMGLKNEFLARIGVYSYSIYIFHVFFTASSRILLLKLNVSQIELIILISLTLGVVGPIVVEKVLERFNIVRALFLGKPAWRERKKKRFSKVESPS